MKLTAKPATREWKTAFFAFAVHISISLIIATLLYGLIFFVWYPTPLAQATNVVPIFLMMLIVDVIIGPLLTLMVYDTRKKSLKMDIAVIIILQLMAMSYGVYSLAQARPVYISFYPNRFNVVQANDIETLYLEGAKQKYQSFSWTGPEYVAAMPPNNNDPLFNTPFVAVVTDNPSTYYPIEEATTDIINHVRPFDTLAQINSPTQVSKLRQDYPTAIGWVPVYAKHQSVTALIDNEGNVVDLVDVNPWTDTQLKEMIKTTKILTDSDNTN